MLRVGRSLCRYSAGAVLQIMLFGIMAIQVEESPAHGFQPWQVLYSTFSAGIFRLCCALPHVAVDAAWKAGGASPTIQLAVHADKAQGAKLPHHPGSCPPALGKGCTPGRPTLYESMQPHSEASCLLSGSRENVRYR